MERARAGWLRAALPTLVVIAVGGVQRALVFVQHRGSLDALLSANPDWYTGQQLPLAMLQSHLATSLLYLQQTPPLPNLVMGLLAKCFAWPAALTYALIALQAILSIATALVLLRILSGLYPRRPALTTALALTFLVNTDLVVLEYNSFGQTFYENLAMLLVVTIVALALALRASDRSRWAIALGATVGLLALTRASWSFFAVPGLVLVVALSRRQRLLRALAFAVPVLLLHGGWAVKNWVVFGRLTPSTSSWSGYNAMNGLRQAGYGDDFRSFILARDAERRQEPGWFVAAVRTEGFPPLPQEFTAFDTDIDRRLGVHNPALNSQAFHALSREYERNFLAFCLHAPGKVLAKSWRAYQLFWHPPAEYGRMFVDLFSAGDVSDDPYSLFRVLRQLLAGRVPAAPLLSSGTWGGITFTRTRLRTLHWLDPFILIANLVGVHVLLPLAAVAALVRGIRYGTDPGRSPASLRTAALAVAATAYAYLAVTTSVVEFGENMRFRLSVEPVIWLITILSASELLAGARRRAA